MIRKFITKKEEILDATLKLVAKKNTFNITIREIAAEADINVAAVNYYFKSKEQLFLEMETLFMDNFKDAFTPLDNLSYDEESRLYEFLKKAISYASHYPGILVLLKDKFNNSDYDSDNQLKLSLLERLAQIKELFISVVQPKEEEEDQLFLSFGSCLMFPFLADNIFPGFGLNMDEEEHLEYMKMIINKIKK